MTAVLTGSVLTARSASVRTSTRTGGSPESQSARISSAPIVGTSDGANRANEATAASREAGMSMAGTVGDRPEKTSTTADVCAGLTPKQNKMTYIVVAPFLKK